MNYELSLLPQVFPLSYLSTSKPSNNTYHDSPIIMHVKDSDSPNIQSNTFKRVLFSKMICNLQQLIRK